ncbi:putative peptidyl-tRNA hydrolase 2 [Oratosquilla oratoria]|uniref:putative peptidyl-tRNA hydrolase 2 n=1 Tax=Oratosquilla oratoria TaxID=337810 RepID=UPI003F771AAB
MASSDLNESIGVSQNQVEDNTKNTVSSCEGQTSSCSSPSKLLQEVKEEEGAVDLPLFDSLVSMGMSKKLSKKALISTHNKSVEAALTWIAELGAEEMEVLCGNSDDESIESEDWEDCEEEEDTAYKMVFVVNAELNMGAGKTASQVGHAALGLYRLLVEDKEKYEASVEEWEEFGEKKITLKGKNTKQLLDLQKRAEVNDLPTYVVQDAGHTQVPEGSITVLAIFGDEEAVNEVTGKLKLL